MDNDDATLATSPEPPEIAGTAEAHKVQAMAILSLWAKNIQSRWSAWDSARDEAIRASVYAR